MSFVIDPSSVSFEQVKADLEVFLETRPDAARWKGFFDSQAGTTVVELIAGLGVYVKFNGIIQRREAYPRHAKNRSSVIAYGESVGFSSFRGRQPVINLTVIPNFTGILSRFQIVGAVKDRDLVLLEDTVVNDGVPIQLELVVGSLKTESITIQSDAPASFRFQQPNVSTDIRVLLDTVEVESSERILDLANEKFAIQTNVLTSVDVMYINLDTFAVRYNTGDILTIEYIEHKDVEFTEGNVVFNFGTISDFEVAFIFEEAEATESVRINAPLFNETQLLIRGRNDYKKVFQLLETEIVSTDHIDLSPAVIKLFYVKDDVSLFSTSEKDALVLRLSDQRTMGLEPPEIGDPTIVFHDYVVTLTLLNASGNPVQETKDEIAKLEQNLRQEVLFADLEKALEDKNFVKIARIIIETDPHQTNNFFARGEHIDPPAPDGFIYEMTGVKYASGAIEPTFPAVLDGIVEDNGLIWQACDIDDPPCNTGDTWSASTVFEIGARIIPTTPDGFVYCLINFINQSGSSFERQTIDFDTAPDGGTFRLEFNGEETADLLFSASANDIETALNGLTSLSEVVVSGASPNFVVDFLGADGNKEQPPITVDSPGQNEQNCVAFDIDPNNGEFKLEFIGDQTPNLLFNITNLALQAQLEALPSIGAGNILVEDGAGGDKWTITFQGALGFQDLADALILVSNTMVAATAVIPTPSTVTEGEPASAGVNEIQLLSFSQVPDIGVDEIQQVDFDLVPDAGLWRLNFDGQQTAPINFNAPAATVEDELEALSTIGVGNVTVTGDYTAGFTISFTGTLEEKDVSQLILASNSLTSGGPNVVVDISTTVAGFDPGKFSINFDGNTTTLLKSNSTDAEVETALEALASIGAGNVSVTGNFSVGFTIEFISALANDDQLLVTIPSNTLTASLGTQVVVITPSTTQEGALPNAGVDEIQLISFDFVPDSGNFRLTFNGSEETVDIAFNDTFTDIQNALNALPSLSGVTVFGNFTAGFTVTFAGADGKIDQPELTVTANTLSSTSAPVTLSIVVCQEGKKPASNLLDGVTPVPIAIVTVDDAVNPEPDWDASVGIEGIC